MKLSQKMNKSISYKKISSFSRKFRQIKKLEQPNRYKFKIQIDINLVFK